MSKDRERALEYIDRMCKGAMLPHQEEILIQKEFRSMMEELQQTNKSIEVLEKRNNNQADTIVELMGELGRPVK